MEEIKSRFLIVDDDKNIRRLCMTVGSSLGFACTEAESAEAALSQIEVVSPDLILADLLMPKMTGLEFLEQIKKLLPHLDVAIMTGHGSIEDEHRPMRGGVDD